MKKRGLYFAASMTGVLLLTLLDQLTKLWAQNTLKEAPIVIWEGVFELQYLENNGAAFGLMQNMHLLFYAATLIMGIAVLYCLWKMPLERKYSLLRVLLVLILAGALGNLIDRVSHHYVIDFFYFSLIDFPIFNVADIYVTCSAITLVIAILLVYKEEDFAFLGRKKESRGN